MADLRADNGIRVISSGVLDHYFREIVCEVLARLPEDDRERAIEMVTGWMIADAAYHQAYSIPPSGSEPRVVRIIVIPECMARSPHAKVQTMIAHELAHVVLGHGPHASSGEQALLNEEEADRQVKKWGFQPAYSKKQIRDRARSLAARRTPQAAGGRSEQTGGSRK